MPLCDQIYAQEHRLKTRSLSPSKCSSLSMRREPLGQT
jgi:hypothetical protein